MKNEFDILNDVKNDVDIIEEISLSDYDKKKISNRVSKKIIKNSRFNKKGLIAASVSIILLGSLMLTNKNVLAQINIIGREIESFFEKKNDTFKIYKDEIVQVSEDKGIKLILHEVMLDDEELYISTSIDYSEFDRSLLNTKYDGDLKIVPKPMSDKFKVLHDGEEVKLGGQGRRTRYNENGTVDILFLLDIKDINLDETYDIKLEIDSMESQLKYKKNEYIDGNWSLDFKINGSEMSNKMKVIDINNEIDLEYKGMKIPISIDSLRISPVAMRFKYNANGLELMGKKLYLEFKFFDEDDKEINFISQGGNSEDGLSYKYMIDRDFEKIKVVPVIYKDGILGRKETEFNDKSIEINLK